MIETLVIIVLAVGTIGMLVAVGWSSLQSRLQPLKQVRAAAVRRRTIASTSTDYMITFRSSDGEHELVVPLQLFVSVEDGTWGTLVYQGEHFKSFVPEQQPERTTVIPHQPSPAPLVDRDGQDQSGSGQ